MSFLNTYSELYEKKLNPRSKKLAIFKDLYQRAEGYKLVFQELEKLNVKKYKFLETGVLRNLGQWKDGQSTFLFQEFLKYHGGTISSVDIDPEACSMAESNLNSEYCKIYCNDSVNFLKNTNKDNVNLYHLDSYDVDFKNDTPSAEHHLNEFKAIESFVKGSLVLIDDNSYYNNKRSGKGSLIYHYLAEKNIFPIYDKYQILYRF